jgi:hypothetical protein
MKADFSVLFSFFKLFWCADDKALEDVVAAVGEVSLEPHSALIAP